MNEDDPFYLTADQVLAVWDTGKSTLFKNENMVGYFCKIGANEIDFTCGDFNCCWATYIEAEFLEVGGKFREYE
jgi:hypothetical protein